MHHGSADFSMHHGSNGFSMHHSLDGFSIHQGSDGFSMHYGSDGFSMHRDSDYSSQIFFSFIITGSRFWHSRLLFYMPTQFFHLSWLQGKQYAHLLTII